MCQLKKKNMSNVLQGTVTVESQTTHNLNTLPINNKK